MVPDVKGRLKTLHKVASACRISMITLVIAIFLLVTPEIMALITKGDTLGLPHNYTLQVILNFILAIISILLLCFVINIFIKTGEPFSRKQVYAMLIATFLFIIKHIIHISGTKITQEIILYEYPIRYGIAPEGSAFTLTYIVLAIFGIYLAAVFFYADALKEESDSFL